MRGCMQSCGAYRHIGGRPRCDGRGVEVEDLTIKLFVVVVEQWYVRRIVPQCSGVEGRTCDGTGGIGAGGPNADDDAVAMVKTVADHEGGQWLPPEARIIHDVVSVKCGSRPCGALPRGFDEDDPG